MLKEKDFSTQRSLFRKISNRFEEHESILADRNLESQSLKLQLENTRPRKRKRVRTSPNPKFADLEKNRRAQIEAREAGDIEDDREEAKKSASTLDCIEIE